MTGRSEDPGAWAGGSEAWGLAACRPQAGRHLELQELLGIAPIDPVTFIGAQTETVNHLDRFAGVEARRGVERHVGGEEHMIHTEEVEAAACRRCGAEERGVGVELLEVGRFFIVFRTLV